MVGWPDGPSLRSCLGSAATCEFAAEFEVLAVGLCERVPQGLCLLADLLFEAGDLGREGQDEVALTVVRWLGPGSRQVLAAEALDAFAQGGVRVEEGVGDAGLALDGLESDRFAALSQGADGSLGGLGLCLGFAAGGAGRGCRCGCWRLSVMVASSGGG